MSEPSFLDYRKLPALPTKRPVFFMYQVPWGQKRHYSLPYGFDADGGMFLSLEHFLAMLHSKRAHTVTEYASIYQTNIISPTQVNIGVKKQTFYLCQREALACGGKVLMQGNKPFALAFPVSELTKLGEAMLPWLKEQAQYAAGIYDYAYKRLSNIVANNSVDLLAAIVAHRRASNINPAALIEDKLEYEPSNKHPVGLHRPAAYYGRPYSLHAVKTNQIGSYCTWLA